ncbi:SdrD B-like domain-containing protein [Cytophaga sp. FL35]|uniref:SdrD B-like domain-containing protein n=1 Tax=Cytophaga sp. FL35 TaxID=1904456 RepID=UPI0016536D1C|nr:SdrD B-like domain-containing protein [Cytophaga sp. FL35]MBC6997281.1 carboxypeptidase regulatory-like domain-containing protein [Cytophaga sp. FL35]
MKKILFFVMALVLTASCSKDDEASIIGTASANDGEVVSGITVKLYTEDTNLLMDTSTDSEGKFAFTDLDVGNYYIGATTVINDTVWDTGNTPQIIYVGGEIQKEVSLTLTQKQ